MALLTLAEILAARTARLNAASAPPLVSPVSLSAGVPTTQLTAIATPPPKKIFSILSWNIRDYKGSKIVAEKKGKEDNPFINQFVKVVAEALRTDLMMIIETDIDLTEAVARIEDERDDLFGHLVTQPPPVPVPVVDDPVENWTGARDDVFYAEVKKRAEALSGGADAKYTAFGSEMAYRKVKLPAKFTLADLQKDCYKHPAGPVSADGEPWWRYLEGVGRCYDVEIKGTAIAIDKLLAAFPTLPASSLNADIVFTRKTTCAACGGSALIASVTTCNLCNGHGKPMDFGCNMCRTTGKLHGPVPCPSCKGAKAASAACACAGKPVCSACNGNRQVPCGACGGPKQLTCLECGGAGRHAGGVCRNCAGRGSGWVSSTCFACFSPGFVPCGWCNGSGLCHRCGGSGAVAVPCTTCHGAGTVEATMDCGQCGGLGHHPRYACTHCKGARSLACAPCAGPGCTQCGGAGRRACAACAASGLVDDAVCSHCLGDPDNIACPTCAATGTCDPEAEEHALQLLRILLTPSVFSNIDVETYTLLWRNPARQLPARVMGSYRLACDDKGVWLDAGRAALRSTDASGHELGYQDPMKAFNSRQPYVIPLLMNLNGKQHQLVPVVLFHAIWGETKEVKGAAKTALVKGRADSVGKLRELGVATAENGWKAVSAADGSILVGDFNVDFQHEKVYNAEIRKHAKGVFAALATDGYVAPVDGTKTGLTTRDVGIQRLQGGKNQDIHTYGYDNYFVKGADLRANIVNCGVFDVLGLIEGLLAKDQKLVDWIDQDYMNAPVKTKPPPKPKPGTTPKAPKVKVRQPFTDNRTRAFYLYYEYISDHLPIILDVLVDEIDPQYKADLLGHEAFILKPIDTPPPRMLGNWTALAPVTSPSGAKFNSPTSVTVCGEVRVVCFPDLVGVWIEGMLFYGACAGNDPSALLGKQVQGNFVPAERAYIEKSDYLGRWESELAPTDTKSFFTQRKNEKQRAIRGRVKWFDSAGRVAVACWMEINGKRVKRVYEGPGTFAAPPALGAWVECIFAFNGGA